jgi:4-diphosphocytidyl-2C-methyl-D-erythritol kinase
MDPNEDPGELERQIERARRLASYTTDQTALSGSGGGVEAEAAKRLAARRSKEQISARAREFWEQHGRPAGRDEEFWLQAESERRKNGSE